MTDLNFYEVLNLLKIKKSNDIYSIEASMKFIKELTAVKALKSNEIKSFQLNS